MWPRNDGARSFGDTYQIRIRGSRGTKLSVIGIYIFGQYTSLCDTLVEKRGRYLTVYIPFPLTQFDLHWLRIVFDV